ncbi:ion channel [Planococcus sp. ISL-109]|uniref:ion channel n=1 Tax=Planococcus sp. ISL-109 TaxID=2819166 RepID=UPI001BE8CE8F|nr:ion channel [Planococcus sp. ISL-109]MBT2582165.1 two pore domain potassium channel family protein [Planococcus sp. ISL-109]
MELFYLIFGIFLVALAIIDFVWTTLWVDGGAGPLTNRLTSAYWTLHKAISNRQPKLLSLAGPFVLILTLSMWIFLLWIGWTLIFASTSFIVDTKDGGPMSWFENAYYAGYLIFTLGNGEFAPDDGIWQIIAILATGSGMLFITFGVTYLLQVLSAVTDKRSLASSISGIALDPAAFVNCAWNGKDFDNVNLLLDTFANDLSGIVSKYNAYPVLHYYRSATHDRSLPVNIVVLDEALTFLSYGIPQQHQPNRLLIQELRSSITSYLDTLHASSIDSSPVVPPHQVLANLNDTIPLVDPSDYEKAMESLETRRRKLLGLLEMTGEEWPGTSYANSSN